MSSKQTKKYFKDYYKNNKKFKCVLCDTKKMNKRSYKEHQKTNIHQQNLKIISMLILK